MPRLTPSILYADAAVVVADKPSGLLSQPAPGDARQDCLELRVRALYPDALLAHRLDMGTSGVILLARGPEMLRRVNAAFAQRTVGKRYVAAVHGHVEADVGEVDLPLAADPDDNPRQVVAPLHGRRAVTRYRVVARCGTGSTAQSRVELEPVTGRTHQIRVHLMSLGHPIIGDPLYAPPESAARHARLHLHATQIAFIHPQRRVPMSFASPAPF